MSIHRSVFNLNYCSELYIVLKLEKNWCPYVTYKLQCGLNYFLKVFFMESEKFLEKLTACPSVVHTQKCPYTKIFFLTYILLWSLIKLKPTSTIETLIVVKTLHLDFTFVKVLTYWIWWQLVHKLSIHCPYTKVSIHQNLPFWPVFNFQIYRKTKSIFFH